MLLPWHRNGVAMTFQFISLADDGKWQIYRIWIMVCLKPTLPLSLGSVSTEREFFGQNFHLWVKLGSQNRLAAIMTGTENIDRMQMQGTCCSGLSLSRR